MPTSSTASIRQWAVQHGFAVATRGRLPAEVLAAYDKAHKQPPKPAGRGTPAARAARRSTSGAQAEASTTGESTSGNQADVVPVEHLVALAARLEYLANRVEALERASQGKRRGTRLG